MVVEKRKIRPAARLLRTIGQDLIKDVYAAIVELVKNAYDADSPEALVKLHYDKKNERLIVGIEDQGDGMSFDTVVNKWLVPATDDKLVRKRSRKKRVLQGRKGIGRFAASVLGERLLLETTFEGITTSLVLDMEELNRVDFLDEIQLEVETEVTGKADGTVIEIEKENISEEEAKSVWSPQQIKKLFVELRSLTAPEEVYNVARQQGFNIYHDRFDIKLLFGDFPIPEYSNRLIQINPFPVLDLYDYKISGKVDENGCAVLFYENQNVSSLPSEEVEIKVPLELNGGNFFPGEIFIDLRVYDRDPESIDNIIKRGLKDPDTGDFLGKREARKVLDEYYGVGVYREQFRIRPYGEQGFDWLDLDKNRVQNPSFKVGHNQVIGFVYVRPEETSGLQEKSARDGLVENGYYYGLKIIILQAIKELEVRRYNYREKAFRGGRNRSLEDEVDLLFDFSNTKNRISKELDELDISNNNREAFEKAVDGILESEKKKKEKYAKKIRDTIAVYQGQATLGRITHVLLHEGRKHIKYITETVPRVNKWVFSLLEDPASGLESKIKERSDKVVTHAQGLSFLFKKIEPLARTRRSSNKILEIETELRSAIEIFSYEIESFFIDVEISIHDGNLMLDANQVDFITVISNLIENSIFWLSQKDKYERKIKIIVFKEDNEIVLEYSDNGPGFQGGNLDLMFDPGYSMKPEGTGLGLALAGEAMSRMNGRIEAKNSENGAMFELFFKGDKK